MEKIFENILLFLFHFQQLSIRLSSNRSTVSIIHYSLSKNTLNDIFLRQIEIKKNFMEEILLNKAMTSYSECSFQKIKCYLIPVIKLSSWKQFVERVSSSFVIELEDLSIIFRNNITQALPNTKEGKKYTRETHSSWNNIKNTGVEFCGFLFSK